MDAVIICRNVGSVNTSGLNGMMRGLVEYSVYDVVSAATH